MISICIWKEKRKKNRSNENQEEEVEPWNGFSGIQLVAPAAIGALH